MQPKWTKRLGLAGLVGAIVWASVGCAQERPPINQVQPNALSKHFFVGADLSDTSDDPEFYMRNTVIDVPYGAAQDGLFTASYAQPLSRVRWEVQENALVARLTYDRVQNTGNQAAAAQMAGDLQPNGMGARRVDNGQVVAMFAISSHFDIRRSYNPQTGEEYNVIVENASDRPWYQREYMRVDWSKNMITDGYDFDTLSQIGIFGGIKWDPETYQITDPNSPNAPAFDLDTGYFDITTKAFATPNTVDTPFGTFPACFLGVDYGGTNSYPIANCSPTELTLRLSFKRVVDNDFEPSDWDGNKMEAFGWFTEDRFGYDRNYGVVDQNWHRYAAKYNIWQQSHLQGSQCAVDYYRDDKGAVQRYQTDGQGGFKTDVQTGLPILAAAGDPTSQPFPSTGVGQDPHRLASDGKTEAECAFADGDGNVIHPGAYCDISSNKCALPTRERKLRTIPWYYGPDSPPDLFASTARALDQWNVAVKRAAVIGQIGDAKRVGADFTDIVGDVASDTNGFPTEDGVVADRSGGSKHIPDVFVLCHNPVVDSDDPSCGSPGLKARVGDIRYNMVNMINTPQAPSPWGIMVDGNDPLTGEKVQTSVNEWAAVLDIASQGTEDLLRWINGEITDAQITNGDYMRDWVSASKLGTGSYQAKTLSTQEIKDRLSSSNTNLGKLNGLKANDTSPKVLQRMQAAKNLSKLNGPSMDSTFEGARKALMTSQFGAQMIDSHWLQAVGVDPNTPFNGDKTVASMASPLAGMNPGLNHWLRRQKGITMASNGFCEVEQPEPDALVGMARMAQKLYPLPDAKDQNFAAKKYQRDQALHQWIREQFHVSVIAHEMGHSMGLRHNFTGSWDALNYKPQYWQLRSRNGQEKACSDVFTPSTDGTKCLGPRWMDPITEPEVNGLLWKWGSTTVMDYPGDQTQDMNDIGSYDKAAMRFCYGQMVDVDTDSNFNPKSGSGNTKGSAYVSAMDGFGGIGGQSIGGLHYTKYNDTFKILNNCGAQSDPNDPLSAKCDWFKLDYVPIRDMVTVDKFGAAVTAVRPDLVSKFAVQPGTNHVRHPYMFGSDEFADIGNVPVFRFDSGADVYEQQQFLISTYENRYIFDNFRRNRTTFQTGNVVARVQDRYLDKVKDVMKTFALLLELDSNPTASQQDPGNLMPFALAGPDQMLTFMRMIMRPEPGPYTITSPSAAQGIVLPFAGAEDINGMINNPKGDFLVPVGSGDGRFIENDYDYTQGYWWGDYQTKVGAWWEKRLAVENLMEGYNYFLANSEQDYVDGRYKNLNFASVYPHQVKRFLAQVLAGDPMTLGGYVQVPSAQLGNAQPSMMYLPWEKDQATIDYPAGSTVVDPLVGWQDQLPTMVWLYLYGGANDLDQPAPFSTGNEFNSGPIYNDTHEELRVWTPGGQGAIDIALADQIRYRDPIGGTVYAARAYGTEQVNSLMPASQRTMAARMLQYAQHLTDLAYTKTGTVVDSDGSGMVYNVYDTANPKDAILAAKLHGYVANLDTARQLAQWWQLAYPNYLNTP
jgi:hypothetical protein